MDDLSHSFVVLVLFAMIAVSSPAVLSQSETPDVSKYAPSPGLFEGMESPSDKTIDQLITEALGGIDVASNKILAPGAYVLAELDMYLSQDQFLNLYEPPSNFIIRGPDGNISRTPIPSPPRRPKRKAARDVILRWPGAQIPYQFARGDFTDKERYTIKQAMTEWERYTCLKFRPASNGDTNVVRFQNGEGCNSQLGMVGGVQLLNLDVAGCRFKGLYLHEMGHAIGLVHEHQLPDRDHYIDILRHNVAPHFRIFFNKYSTAVVNQFTVPYQYSSVMHYGITAFSYNGEAQTIRPKDRSKESSIGKIYLKELAFSDVKVVNEMYSCSAFCSDTVRCEGEGYLDQNCDCVCPDGTDSCEVRTDSSASSDNDGDSNDDKKKDNNIVDEKCENKYENWKCAVWANQGECERNPRYMTEQCARACGQCITQKLEQAKNHFTTWAWQWFGMFTSLFPREWMIGVCKDVYTYEKCYKWKQQGDCVTNERWMKNKCKMTCNFCGNPALRAETKCKNNDDDKKCDKWAMTGECVLNKKWMIDHCPRSCHACEGTLDSESDDEKKKEEEEKEKEEEEEMTCVDKHNVKECERWARAGECSANPTWMIANCRGSCAKCDDGSCKNLYDDTQCEVWGQEMECMRNREWMHDNCAKACGVCNSKDTDTDKPKVDDHDDDDDDEEEEDKTQAEDDNTRAEDDNSRGYDDDKTQSDDDRGSVVTQRPVVTRRPNVRTTRMPDTETCFNNHNDVECEAWAKTGHCDINPQWMHKQCAKACHRCTKDTHQGREEVCRDRNSGCAGWAQHGFCDSNPRYNLIYCKKACGSCNGCRDEQFLCRVWAKAGHCKTNASFMLRQCQRSCAICE